MDFISRCSLSPPPLLFPLLFSLSSRLVHSFVSYQELVLWSSQELSSGYEIRFFFPSGCMHGNTTKAPVRAELQKWAPNGAVIIMYSLQDIDVRLPPPVKLGYLGADSGAAAASLRCLVSCLPCCVCCILKAWWKQLNACLMARSWQKECTIELVVMMVCITQWSKWNYLNRLLPLRHVRFWRHGMT